MICSTYLAGQNCSPNARGSGRKRTAILTCFPPSGQLELGRALPREHVECRYDIYVRLVGRYRSQEVSMLAKEAYRSILAARDLLASRRASISSLSRIQIWNDLAGLSSWLGSFSKHSNVREGVVQQFPTASKILANLRSDEHSLENIRECSYDIYIAWFDSIVPKKPAR